MHLAGASEFPKQIRRVLSANPANAPQAFSDTQSRRAPPPMIVDLLRERNDRALGSQS